MEVGPLNSIKPPVQEPRDGKTERTGKISSERNRLQAEASKAVKPDSDDVRIANKSGELENNQQKIAFANTAKQAVQIIIDGIKSMKTTTSPETVKGEIDRAMNAEFNGQPVFNGETLTGKNADGSETTVKVPGVQELKDKVAPLIKDAIAGKEAERKAYKEIDDFYKDLDKLSDGAREKVKQHIGASNAGASRSRSKDIRDVRDSLKELSKQPDRMRHFNPPQEMTDKVVKLLK